MISPWNAPDKTPAKIGCRQEHDWDQAIPKIIITVSQRIYCPSWKRNATFITEILYEKCHVPSSKRYRRAYNALMAATHCTKRLHMHGSACRGTRAWECIMTNIWAPLGPSEPKLLIVLKLRTSFRQRRNFHPASAIQQIKIATRDSWREKELRLTNLDQLSWTKSRGWTSAHQPKQSAALLLLY
jgi:hypothetical protein